MEAGETPVSSQLMCCNPLNLNDFVCANFEIWYKLLQNTGVMKSGCYFLVVKWFHAMNFIASRSIDHE